MALSALQQHLFNYFNLVKVSSSDSAEEIFNEAVNSLSLEKSSLEGLLGEVHGLNQIIQKFDLEVVEMVDEITCEKLFILVNTADNTVTQRSKFYGENISQFFSKIVKDIVLSSEGYVSATHCLNLSSQVKLSKSAAQTVLEKLQSDKWLISRSDKISLGMRTIAELEQNIKQNYPDDVTNCNFCTLIVIQGYICHNCKLKCHFACLKKYIKQSKSNSKCPSCREVWVDIPEHLQSAQNIQSYTSQDDVVISKGPPRKKKKSVLED